MPININSVSYLNFLSLVRDHAFRISEFLGGEGVKEIRIFSDMGGRGSQGNSDIRKKMI